MSTLLTLSGLLLMLSQAGTAAASAYPNASAFPIELEQQLHELDVGVEAGSSENMAWIRLANAEPRSVHCAATFRNGPEIARTRQTTIEPGQTTVLSDAVHRPVLKMRIRVECNPTS
ncbi:hypothetical protein GCM10011348_27390 [Marinobacterium nitratireducens]|uniref:3-phosphoglycerate kinase n=1 Tax=Marinobacterium nitratireducens TaxID=518897 RepID=A0A918DV75_9GAMM|nr:hypothetical protein [Marinobacterium nitratireducens]GGO83490.1 hypothetical protein GCM10011348_27390 [Marinobacterium nitratireducens]